MKLFTDNRADAGTVSGTDATVNYPASNVQDSSLSRIYRGGEQVDFDISGSGALQNISQAYTNLVQDPTDLTTANWTNTNSTDAISTLSINGNLFTKVTNVGAFTGRMDQDFVATFSNLNLTGQVIIKKGDSAGNTTLFSVRNTTGATNIFTIAPDWDNFGVSPATPSAGTLLDYDWIDSETLKLNFACDALANLTDNVQLRCYGSSNATTAEYTYWTEVQLIDEAEITMFPFVDGTHAIDIITETDTLADKQTFDIIYEPRHAYNTGTNHTVYSYYIDATHYLRLYYDFATDTYILAWRDGGTERTMTSQQFGGAFTNLNQRIKFTLSLDVISGSSSTSRFICLPLESGAVNEDTTFSGATDVKTATTFTTISIGQTNSLTQADGVFEYVRRYEGLLVGTATTEALIAALLEPKKILLDKTYQQKLTATDLLIANSTINDGDTITLRGNNVDSYASGTPLDETVTWSKDITTHTFTKASYQFWRLSVNSSNIIDMGRIYLGEAITPPDISPTLTHDKISTSVKSTSSSGQTYLDIRYKYVSINTTFPAVTHAQKAIIFSIMDDIDIGTPFFVTFDETEIDLNTLYVTLGSDTLRATLLQDPDYYTIGFTLVEEV